MLSRPLNLHGPELGALPSQFHKLLLVGEEAEQAELPNRQIACPHAAEIPHEGQDVRVELVKVQELRHPRPAELEPPGEVGSSVNDSGVEEPLELIGECQSLGGWRYERFIQRLGTQTLSGLAEVDDEATQNSPTTDPVGEPNLRFARRTTFRGGPFVVSGCRFGNHVEWLSVDHGELAIGPGGVR